MAFKREFTVNDGLMTPMSFVSRSTFASATPALTLKREDTEIDHFQEDLPRDSPTQLNNHENAETNSTHTLDGGEGLKVLGHDVNRLVSLIDKLRRIGLKSVEGTLPELVLVGDQSAGKSSLMGAIAEIHLPKKAAMCTRCPYNIKTSPATDWECTVALQEDYAYNPSWRKSPFPKWQPQETMTNRLFTTITSKSELEEALSWAQIALLNPSKDINDFVPGSREQASKKQMNDESIEAQYSPNVIAVEIKGPGLSSLSFFDLPGLFQDAGSHDLQFLVPVFDRMTMKYIDHPQAIIICALSMANDAALSKTKRIIGEHKADKKCIGVLTMPDRMQGSALSHPDYNGIFNNTSHRLPRGYYVTKQPGPDCRLDRTSEHYHALARQEEESFFDESPHWGSDGEWSEFRNRCGTATIQRYLSKEFARKILYSIPGLTEQIVAQTAEVEKELANLPEIAHDQVQSAVRDACSVFSVRARSSLEGTLKNDTLHSDWEKVCYQFAKALEVMRPGIVCSHSSDLKKDVIRIDLDSDTESTVSYRGNPTLSTPNGNTARRQRDDDQYMSGSSRKRPRFHNTPVPMHVSSLRTPSGLKHENMAMQPPVFYSVAARKLKIDEIGEFRQAYLDSGYHAMSITGLQEDIRKARRAGVPGEINPDVKKDLALGAVISWDQPLETYIDETFKMVRKHLGLALSWALQQHQKTEFYAQSMAHLDAFLTEYETKQRAATMEFYEIEKQSLFTVNLEAFHRNRVEAHEALKQNRREQRVKAYTQIRLGKEVRLELDPEKAIKDKATRKKFMDAVTDEQLGPDTFEQELEVAAYIRGYYTTARHRFTDSVCLNMHTRYLRAISAKLHGFLEDKFSLNRGGDAEATCRMLLESNPDMSRQRTQLQHRERQLAEFSQTLNELRADFSIGEELPSDIEMDDGVSNFGGATGYNGQSAFNY